MLTSLVTDCRAQQLAQAASPTQWARTERQMGYVVFQHNNLQLADTSLVPARQDIVKKVACELARGEYDPIQIGIHALVPGVNNVQLEVESDLDVKVYRRIDDKVRGMLLAYSNPMPSWSQGGCLDESNVIDSVAKGSTEVFWIVVHAKPDTTPGMHHGKIRITSDCASPSGKSATELELQVRVRSFVLQRPRIAYFPFFYINWGPAPLPKFAQTDAWIRRFYQDMAEHSHTSVTIYGYDGPAINLRKVPPPDSPYLSVLLPMAKEVGLVTPDIPCVSWVTDLGPHESEGGPSVEQKNQGMAWYESERRKHGLPELISYGTDEPVYPSPKVREYLEPFRQVRVRIGVAMSAAAAYGHSDVHDVWIVYAGQITPEMRAEAQRLGAELWTYSCNLFSYQSIPSRYYAGLYMWAYRLKGHTLWHHYAQTAYKHVWVREGDERPMPTIGWETCRDGIDDYRYLQMLDDSIAANPGDVVAAEAQSWLDSLRERLMGKDPHLAKAGNPLDLDEYDRIKSRAADYIEKLGPVPEGKMQVFSPRGLKDEARLFRAKPVQQCLQGLKNDDPTLRRAAAWALHEMGPLAAPATQLLAGQLEDPEARMPALRALEAIGPKAFAAVPRISELLSHPDGYVRLGATFALVGIGSPWPVEGEAAPGDKPTPSQAKTVAESLRVVLKDELYWVPFPALDALARMGPAAKPALPEAIELLDRPYEQWVWDRPAMIRRIIAAIGPEAGEAVPKLVQIVNKNKGDARQEMLTLAAIGQSGGRAVPVLLKYASEGSPQRGCAYYTLFCIRENPKDLKNMIDVLKNDERGRTELARYLDALGVKARPAARQVGQMMKLKEFDKQREKLESFLEKVEREEGPTPIIP